MAKDRDCGQPLREPFSFYVQNMRAWKTSQLCLDGEWSEFWETWPHAGMTRSGKAYELPTLARRTAESESGLWPTPRVEDHKDLLGSQGEIKGNRFVRPSGEDYSIPRSSAVQRCPTPRAIDGRPKGNGPRPDCLMGWANYEDGKRIGTLNPSWVDWLMGYPTDWTALEGWAMRSSRKSRNSSGEK